MKAVMALVVMLRGAYNNDGRCRKSPKDRR